MLRLRTFRRDFLTFRFRFTSLALTMFCAIAALGLSACGDDDCEGSACEQDAGNDSGSDAGSDALMDAAEDAEQDSGEEDTNPGACADCDGVCDGDECLPTCEDRTECDSGEVCVPVRVDQDGDGTDDGTATVCDDLNRSGAFPAFPCSSDDECSTLACYEGRCTEVCNGAEDCLNGQSCESIQEGELGPYNACVAEPNPDDIAEYTIFDDSVSGSFPLSTLFVPDSATAVTFEAYAGNDSQLIVLNAAVDSTSLFDYEDMVQDPENLVDQPIRWLPGDRMALATMLISNTDRVPFSGGRYAFIPAAFDSGSVDATVRAYVRHIPLGGTLRIRVHIAQGLEFDASSASTHPRLVDTLDAVQAIYAAASITLQIDGYEDIDNAAFSVIDSVRGQDSELARLFESSGTGSDPVLHLFLVRGFDSGGVLGIAGGIPGPVGVSGTNMSGVAASFDRSVVGNGTRYSSTTIAHEIGHYLGLFHTREQSGGFAGGVDAIDDTSTSSTSNLMYWSVESGNNTTLSEGQNAVLGANPLVR